MDAMKPSKRQLCRQAMKTPLNLTALPIKGEGTQPMRFSPWTNVSPV